MFRSLQSLHDIFIIDRALRLNEGTQGQIHNPPGPKTAFSALLMDDVCVLSRPISVLEHAVSYDDEASSATLSISRRQRTYFIDGNARVDTLRDNVPKSVDETNRT